MMKLLYRLFSLMVSVLGGLVAGALFKRLWKLLPGPQEVPKATDEQFGWREVLPAAALQGTAFGLVKAVIDRGGAKALRTVTGVWPGD